MAIAEDLDWLARDLHYSRIRSGYYRDLVVQATGVYFDQAVWGRIAKETGCSTQVLDALLNGLVEPTLPQFRRLNEALRTAVAEPVREPALNGAAS